MNKYKITVHEQEHVITVLQGVVVESSMNHPWMAGRTLTDVTDWVRRANGTIIRIEAPALVLETPSVSPTEATTSAPTESQRAFAMLGAIQKWLSFLRGKKAEDKETT